MGGDFKKASVVVGQIDVRNGSKGTTSPSRAPRGFYLDSHFSF
jgi:hypothetical protein